MWAPAQQRRWAVRLHPRQRSKNATAGGHARTLFCACLATSGCLDPIAEPLDQLAGQFGRHLKPAVAGDFEQRREQLIEQLGGLAEARRWRYSGGFIGRGTGLGEIASGINARVAATPFRS
jgi:hypothetical protein